MFANPLSSPCAQWVACIDMAANDEANENVIVKPCESFTEQAAQVSRRVTAGTVSLDSGRVHDPLSPVLLSHRKSLSSLAH